MPTKRTGRPRGRPPGAKNKPKNIEEFILQHIRYVESMPAQPPRKPKAKAKPRGIWVHMTPEERKAYSRKLVEARQVAPLNGP